MYTNELLLFVVQLKINMENSDIYIFFIRTEQGQWRIQDFPLGGAKLLGGTNLQRGHFLAKMYAKTKELDPVGGTHAGGAP